MAERMDWQVRNAGEPSWLAGLIDRLEMVSQSEQRATPCEPAMIAACQRYLGRARTGMVASSSTLLH